MRKRCAKCSVTKPISEFHRNATLKDGRQRVCKICHLEYLKSHYWRNRDYYLAKASVRNPVITAKHRELIRELKDVPCADCQRRYPYWVMQFDHVRGIKEFTIGRGGARINPDRIRAEVAKCDVLCANCHAERTYRRLTARDMSGAPGRS
ncbi:MAG: hypothetical protein QOE92_1980 [Chloroflexota bacterium]|nr:hypothetical protein [Chloroflexota bacterium]